MAACDPKLTFAVSQIQVCYATLISMISQLAIAMGPKTERLIAALEEVVFLLQKQGDNYHANQVTKGKLLLEQSDFRGISHVLGTFNGKNSIHEIDWLSDEDEPKRISVGDRFRMLSSTIYELADSIRREVEGGER